MQRYVQAMVADIEDVDERRVAARIASRRLGLRVQTNRGVRSRRRSGCRSTAPRMGAPPKPTSACQPLPHASRSAEIGGRVPQPQRGTSRRHGRDTHSRKAVRVRGQGFSHVFVSKDFSDHLHRHAVVEQPRSWLSVDNRATRVWAIPSCGFSRASLDLHVQPALSPCRIPHVSNGVRAAYIPSSWTTALGIARPKIRYASASRSSRKSL